MILAHLGRLWVHYRMQPSDAEADLVQADWVAALASYDDGTIAAAADNWLLTEEWMPTLAGFLGAVQSEARFLARTLAAEHALPAGPRNDEPLADSHVWAETIRAATGMLVVDPDEKRRGDELRGHRHDRGAAHCPVCTAQRKIDAATRTFVPPQPAWSPCRECDGSHFVYVDETSVRPCSECNGFSYALWLGGHYEPGHRCEECAPSRRRRQES